MAGELPLTQLVLNSLNGEESRDGENRDNLNKLGGVEGLALKLGVDLLVGLSSAQVLDLRAKYGCNVFPETPFTSYLELLLGALSDTTLLILLAAAAVSFGLGYYNDPQSGWIDGAAIFVAVFLVSNIAAGNDYSKELQFRALEKASDGDQRASVLRNGIIERVVPTELVVGDILILQVSIFLRSLENLP